MAFSSLVRIHLFHASFPADGITPKLLCVISQFYNAPSWLKKISLFFPKVSYIQLKILGSSLLKDPGLFLYIFPVYLRSLLLTPSEICTRSWHRMEEVWIRHSGHWWWLWARWRYPQLRFSQKLRGRLPTRVQTAVNRKCIPKIASDSLMGLFHYLSLPIVMEALLSFSGCFRREMDFFSSIPHSWGRRHSSLLPLFLMGEITSFF